MSTLTDVNVGYETNPLRIGAPLPESLVRLAPPEPGAIHAELLRAEVEFMHAIARHRKAWSAMRRWKEHREEAANTPGGLAAMESDPVWKKRTGDVQWWRAEMEARAASVVALRSMLADRSHWEQFPE